MRAGRLGEGIEIIRVVIVGPGRQNDPVANIAGRKSRARAQPGHRAGQHGTGRAKTGDIQEMPPRDRAFLVAPEFLHEFLFRDVVRCLGHNFPPSWFGPSLSIPLKNKGGAGIPERQQGVARLKRAIG